jgi:nucleoside-diphosphate-sugar epimerase
MRVLLTGASGFVAGPTRRALQAAGNEVVPLYRQRPHMDCGDSLVWDLMRDPPTSAAGSRFDAVVHLAQSRNYRRFPEDAREMFDVNVLGTQRLLDFAATAGVKRFCLVSSGTVYEPFAGVLREDAPVAPFSYLGASKLAAEVITRPYTSQFAVTILRLFQPYGPGQAERLIPNLIWRIRASQPVTLSCDGDGLRLVPTFVDDIAQVIVAAIGESWQGTFNVAAPTEVSVREIAEAIGRLLEVAPRFELTTDDPIRIVPDLGKLAERYSLRRFRDLDAGLAVTLATTTSAP